MATPDPLTRRARARRRRADPDLPGPFAVGTWADGFQEFLRQRPRVLLLGEVFNLRRARANTYFELRDAEGAAPCCIWNSTLDRLRLPEGALRDGVEVVVGGGPDYYPGSAAASPSFNFRCDHLRLAGEGDLLAQLDRSRRTLAADGLLERQARPPPPGAAADDRRRHRALERRLRRPARRARAPRLARDDRLGRRPGPGPPRRAGDRPRAHRPGRDRAGRGRGRLPRRRQPLRPVGVLRREPLPHGRDAAAAGGQRGRPRGRPDADRRGRRGLLLDPDPRRRGAGAASTSRAARGELRAGAAPRPARRRRARSPAAPSGSPSARGRPTRDPARRARAACTSCCARCAPPPPAAQAERRRLAAHPRAGGRAQGRRRSRPRAPRRCKRLDAIAAALGAHDPERTLARGYALVADADGEPVTSAAAARERGGLPSASPTMLCGRGSRAMEAATEHDPRTTRPRSRGSSRSSPGSTRARPSCARRSRSAPRPRA